MGRASIRTVGLSPERAANPRRAAAVLVAEVLERRRTLDEAMAEVRSFNALEGRDRAFARAVASATLRRLGTVDAALARFLARPLPEEAALARAMLRTAAAQLLALDMPAHAVVHETVALARSAPSVAPFSGLMNAVLRRIGEQRETLANAPPGADLPDWLFARWRAVYGEADARTIAAALRSEPPLDLTVRADRAEWAQRLGGVALDAAPHTVRLPAGGDVGSLPGYADGAWWVQDAAAAKIAPMLGDVSGREILDLCAAPGGKTMQLASAGARVTALDISAQRLDRLKDNLMRTKLEADIVCADALAWEPRRLFDAVLLDAPCTATGTLRRHPEAAWLRRPSDILTMADLQSRLLARAAALTKRGGLVLYAVCSLEPEEGEAIVDASALTPVGPRLRTTPATAAEVGGMDGFFACLLRKD